MAPRLSVRVTVVPARVMGNGAADAEPVPVARPSPKVLAIESGAMAGPVKLAADTVSTRPPEAVHERLLLRKTPEFTTIASSAKTLAGEGGLS